MFKLIYTFSKLFYTSILAEREETFNQLFLKFLINLKLIKIQQMKKNIKKCNKLCSDDILR